MKKRLHIAVEVISGAMTIDAAGFRLAPEWLCTPPPPPPLMYDDQAPLTLPVNHCLPLT